jgi:hypothetical protein
MDEMDVYRSAKLLIDQYGADALAHAGRRMQERLSRRHTEGAGIWRRVRKAIRDLQVTRGQVKP